MYPQRSKISKPRVPFFPSPSPELLTRDPAGINEESPLRISVGSGGEGGGVSRFVGWRGLWIPNPAYIRFASNCMQFDAANGAEKGRREEGGRAVKLLSGLESRPIPRIDIAEATCQPGGCIRHGDLSDCRFGLRGSRFQGFSSFRFLRVRVVLGMECESVCLVSYWTIKFEGSNWNIFFEEEEN